MEAKAAQFRRWTGIIYYLKYLENAKYVRNTSPQLNLPDNLIVIYLNHYWGIQDWALTPMGTRQWVSTHYGVSCNSAGFPVPVSDKGAVIV